MVREQTGPDAASEPDATSGSRTPREQAFLAFAASHRDLLRGVALLLVPDVARAERLASSVLARRYGDLRSRDPVTTALAELVRPEPRFFDPPWGRPGRVELVDGTTGTAAGTGAEPSPAAALHRLPPEQRAALVLVVHAGLTPAAAGAVLGSDAAAVAALVAQASNALTAGRPGYNRPGALGEELRALVDGRRAPRPPGEAATEDLAHGRRLAGRSRTQRGAALVAAVLVAVLAVVALQPGGRDAASVAPPAVASATAVPSTPLPEGAVVAQCDVRQPECQATVMRQWRTEMSRVVASHLDPEGIYFTGYSFSYDPRYDSPGFWAGRGGALGLELFRLSGGATEVYLQVSTTSAAAVRCGRLTGQRCASRRMMDGNRFTLSPSVELRPGIEVQCWADVDRLVSVVARNTTRGRALDVTEAELLTLVQDPRLRLPVI